MTSIVQEFIDGLGEPVYSFPPGLRETYSEMIEDFRSRASTRGFDGLDKKQGFHDSSPRGVAHRMYWWFPTHFFKFQQSLLLWEQYCRKLDKPFLLNRAKVTFVDLGCGAGAASAAILAVLEQYQHFRNTRNMLSNPIDVSFVGLDPVTAELSTYETLLRLYAKRIKDHDISVRFRTIEGEFPDQISEVASALSNREGHTILIGMSNLINWIWKEYDELLEQGSLPDATRLNAAETTALRELAEQLDYDYFHVIGIAVQKGRYSFLPWKLKRFFLKLLRSFKLAKRPFGTRWGAETRTVFENPEGSGWVKQRLQASSDFYVESLFDAAPDYVRDRKLQDVVSSLEPAWAKIRCYMRYESFTDQIELRLFENRLEANLTALKRRIYDRCFDRFNVAMHIPYDFPKGRNQTRPRSLARFEDQVIAAAICIAWKNQLQGTCPTVSYSHRLARRRTEFLYRYWFRAYRDYQRDVLRSFDGGQVLTTDIRSYYTNIQQAVLVNIVQKRLQRSSRCCDMVSSIIKRDCGSQHRRGYGLLQGHAVSGLLANVMLQPVDARLVTERGLAGRYFRFADDMSVTRIGGKDRATDDMIQSELAAHDQSLVLNDEKTHYFSESDFKRRISGCRSFDSLGKRFRALLLPVFLANREYRQQLDSTGWSFIHTYGELLGRIGIYFSAEWLHRKLDEYGKLKRRMRCITRKWWIHWPSFSLASRASGKRVWQRQFASANSGWVKERGELQRAFRDMFVRAAHALLRRNLSEIESRRQRRAAKFALYRLSVLGLSHLSDIIVKLLINQPWNMPVGIACRALAREGCEDALKEVFRQSTSAYVRAVTLRALGKTRTPDSVSILTSVLDNHASKIERLMASEGLLDANLWHDIELDSVKEWLWREVDHPYVQKNIILILGQAYPSDAPDVLEELGTSRLHDIIHQAIHYVLMKPVSENLLWKAEPEILQEYRAKSYPTIEELLGDEGSYFLMSG